MYSVGTEHGIDEAIYAIKYKGRTQLAEILGERLGHHCLDKGLTADVIVPVPIHRARKRERGYNQAWHIAVGVRSAMNIDVTEHLVRNRNTASQTTLSDAQRQSNVSAVFAMAKNASVRGNRVMLVDDVLTTGATMNRCAEVLLEAGASRVDAIAIGAYGVTLTLFVVCNMPTGKRLNVVVIGAGFGGLSVINALGDAPVNITIIDRTNHHLFQPLLYQVTTAGLSPGDIAHPIRSILRRSSNVHVVFDTVTSIDP